MNNWFDIAERAGEESKYPRINIGACIVNGNYLVATGFNQKKSHPIQALYNSQTKDFESNNYLHAEIHSLIRSGREDVRGADIYVFRKNKKGLIANSRPCVACWAAIKASGISRVYYTTEEGYFYEST